MWLLTPEGFFSATGIPGHETEGVQVRARVRADLERMLDHLDPDDTALVCGQLTHSIVHTPYNDYEYRVYLTHEQWAEYVAGAALRINYSNFKDEVTRRQGNQRHNVYLRVWGVLNDGLGDIEHPKYAAYRTFWDQFDEKVEHQTDEEEAEYDFPRQEATISNMTKVKTLHPASKSAKKRARRKAQTAAQRKGLPKRPYLTAMPSE